jgi:two-component system sensor histidine kinase UhpB
MERLHIMATNRTEPATAADLRRRAQERMISQPLTSLGQLSEAEIQRLFQEVQIQRIELEMQNEELRDSRVNADAALCKSEREFRDLFEAIPAGVYFCDAEGLITSFNKRAAEVWGREPKRNDSADRFCGSFRLFTPDGSPIAREQCWMARSLHENKEYLGHEIVVERPDGSRRLLLAHASPLHDESGQIIGGLNVVIDITESKRVEAALHESEERLKMAVGAAVLGIFEHDHGTDTTYWSPVVRQIFGWNDEEPASLPAYLELVHPQDRAEVEQSVRHAHDSAGDGLYRIEHRIVLRDGAVRWINVRSRTTFVGFASDCHAVNTIGTITDVTDLKLAEEAVREHQSRLQLVVKAANIGMWDWDLLSNEVYLSPEWKSQLGFADDELPNQFETWTTRIHPDDRERMLADVKGRLEKKNQRYEVEFRMRHKDGSWRWILNRDDFLCAPNGQPVRMMGCHIDITSRKKSEADFQASRDRLASLARQLIAAQETERRHLARELHDEIGQVLSAISVNLKTVHRKVDPALRSPLEESVDIVDRAIQQVRELSLDLRPAMLDDFGLEAALSWYVKRFADRTGLAAHFTAHMSRLDLPETLRNTCFRLAQESLTNVLRHAKAQQVWIDLYQYYEELTLTIRDDGQGFDVPLASERAVRGGSLGLINMQERVELLNGWLDIESKPGAGTLVRARLPVPILEDSTDDDEEIAHP